MSEELTITLREDVARSIEAAVEHGEFPSASDALATAWLALVESHAEKVGALRAALSEGDRALAEGRVSPYDRQKIIAGGRISASFPST